MEENLNNSKCPNCGFDFSEFKPQLDYYDCSCKKYCAEITTEEIRFYSMSRDYACGIHFGFDVLENS